MRKFFIPIFFLIAATSVFVGCKDTEKTDSAVEQDDTEMAISTCKNLLIIAEDRSGSTTDHRKLEVSDYEQIISLFEEKGSGQIAVRVIGNPSPSEREFFLLTTSPLKEHKEIEKGLKMSEKAKIRKDNEKIDAKNESITEKNAAKASKFIEDVITTKVIGYTPNNKKDVTDVEDALKHLTSKINEPVEYDNVWVLIVSDGKHDSSKLKVPLNFNPENSIELYLIGWEDKTVFANVSEKEFFESAGGFIEYFKNINCN